MNLMKFIFHYNELNEIYILIHKLDFNLYILSRVLSLGYGSSRAPYPQHKFLLNYSVCPVGHKRQESLKGIPLTPNPRFQLVNKNEVISYILAGSCFILNQAIVYLAEIEPPTTTS